MQPTLESGQDFISPSIQVEQTEPSISSKVAFACLSHLSLNEGASNERFLWEKGGGQVTHSPLTMGGLPHVGRAEDQQFGLLRVEEAGKVQLGWALARAGAGVRRRQHEEMEGQP